MAKVMRANERAKRASWSVVRDSSRVAPRGARWLREACGGAERCARAERSDGGVTVMGSSRDGEGNESQRASEASKLVGGEGLERSRAESREACGGAERCARAERSDGVLW